MEAETAGPSSRVCKHAAAWVAKPCKHANVHIGGRFKLSHVSLKYLRYCTETNAPLCSISRKPNISLAAPIFLFGTLHLPGHKVPRAFYLHTDFSSIQKSKDTAQEFKACGARFVKWGEVTPPKLCYREKRSQIQHRNELQTSWRSHSYVMQGCVKEKTCLTPIWPPRTSSCCAAEGSLPFFNTLLNGYLTAPFPVVLMTEICIFLWCLGTWFRDGIGGLVQT